MTTRRLPPHLLFLGVVLVLIGTLGACGTSPYRSEKPDSTTLHVFLSTAAKSLDPVLAQDAYSNILVLNIYDQLYEYEYLKRPFELKPCIAAALPEVSEDALTYTIRLKRGIRYIDDPCFEGGKGRELKAQDVVFCFKRLMDSHSQSTGTWLFAGKIVGLDAFREASATRKPKNPHRAAYTAEEDYPEVAGLEAVDDYTVRFKLTEPYPQFVYTLAMGYTSIYPREAVAHYGARFPEECVGSGPYIVEDANLSKKVVLRKNPGYREDRFPTEGMPGDEEKNRLVDAGKRLPLNERVVITVFKETQPRWLYFMRGYLDITDIPSESFEGAVDQENFELLAPMAARGIHLDKDPRMDIVYDCFNMEDDVVGAPAGEKGLAIRRAIQLATDNAWAIKNLYNGRAARVDGPILKEFQEYDPDYLNPWKRRPDETRAQALERARKILAEAGYPNGEGIPVLVKDISDTSSSRDFFLAFQRDVKEVGIRVEPFVVTFPEMMRRLNNKKAQLWGVAWNADYPDPQNFFQLFYGPNKAPGVNKSCFDNPEFNDLYAKACTMLPSPERTRMYRRMQEIVGDEVPWSFRCRRRNFILVQPWFYGYRYNDMGQKYFKYCRVDGAKRAAGVRKINDPVVWPVLAFLAFVVVAIAVTLITARRRVRGW